MERSKCGIKCCPMSNMQLSVFHWIPLLFKWSPYTPFKGLRKASPPYTLLLPSGTSAVQPRAGCEQGGRIERPRCSGLQPHAFHSDMKARSLPSSKATSRKKKHGGKRREGKKKKKKKRSQTCQTPKYGRTFSRVKSSMCVLGHEKHQSCFLIGGKRRKEAAHKKRHVLIINYMMCIRV